MPGSLRATTSIPSVLVCHACDLAHRDFGNARERLRCARCRAPLKRPQRLSLDAALALSLCAVVLFVLSNVYPLVNINAAGTTRFTTLTGAALGLYHQDYAPLAYLVFLTAVAAPGLQIAALLYLLVPLWRGREAAAQAWVFRMLVQVRPWTLVEVFILGSLVALVRLAAYATVVPGVALGAYFLLMLLLATLTSATSPEQYWRWVAERA